ncbi:hypothetical protein [Absidia glauca]|uniref:Uncharacterized protein n=1 Tax=Absidia glauca TaxID=4829 RepID=A0A168PPL2_ABSGL|nr:hypothetical protein [Absidia glauca]
MEGMMLEHRRRKRQIAAEQEELQRRMAVLNKRMQQEDLEEERCAARYMQNIPQPQVEVFRSADRDVYLRDVMRSRRRNTNPRTRGDYNPMTENL